MPGRFGLLVIVPAQQTQSEIEDVDALLLFQGTGIVPDVEQALLQGLQGQLGLQFQIGVTAGRRRGVVRLGADKVSLKNIGLDARQEGHGLAVGQQAQHLDRPFVDDLHRAHISRAQRQVQQAVTRRQVEQGAALAQQTGTQIGASGL